ncbi:general secretion pathway protein GspK [Candidatus Uabimicrobium sp. HlEnr_7]|uniref:general secretion pathway protein GspK n=1 Tax=Candidatus Uabimicrobium helgolandensis TaxID=3095367 RepID=UPI00355760BB
MIKKNRGIALVMVLMLSTILVVVVSEFAYSCKVDAYIAYNQAHDLQNRYALISFLNRAIARIQLDALSDQDNQDKNSQKEKTYDSIFDPWALQGKKWGLELQDTKVEGKIVDEERKFPLLQLVEKKKKSKKNSGKNQDKEKEEEKDKDKDKKSKKVSYKDVFVNLLKVVSKQEGKVAQTTHDNIVAWLKEKSGKMKDKYPTKVAIYSLKELLLAKGINNLILLGGRDKKDRKVRGLSEHVTIWSKGKVNINTASPEVLLSLSSKMTPEIVGAIISKRSNKSDILKKTSELPQKVSEVTKSIFAEIKEKIGVESQYFRITAIATTENVKKKMVAVVHRQEKKVFTIYCEIK